MNKPRQSAILTRKESEGEKKGNRLERQGRK